jgi:hypothetical protein
MRIILRDEAKPDGPPGFDRLVASERLTIRGLRQRYVRAGLGGRLVCQQEPDRNSALNLSPADRDWVVHLMFFKPRHDVSRVIFMASPFKGSKTADMILFRFSSRLVRFPAELKGHHYRVFTLNRSLMVKSKENRLIAGRQPSSIDLLSPESPETIALGQLKVAPWIPFHLIIGIRHGSNVRRSSDGIVAYSSSYLEGAESELATSSNTMR